jgi:hypothetical protein
MRNRWQKTHNVEFWKITTAQAAEKGYPEIRDFGKKKPRRAVAVSVA